MPRGGNGCAERFLNTLQEKHRWVQTFAAIEELFQALLASPCDLQYNLANDRHGAGFTHPRPFETSFHLRG